MQCNDGEDLFNKNKKNEIRFKINTQLANSNTSSKYTTTDVLLKFHTETAQILEGTKDWQSFRVNDQEIRA